VGEGGYIEYPPLFHTPFKNHYVAGGKAFKRGVRLLCDRGGYPPHYPYPFYPMVFSPEKSTALLQSGKSRLTSKQIRRLVTSCFSAGEARFAACSRERAQAQASPSLNRGMRILKKYKVALLAGVKKKSCLPTRLLAVASSVHFQAFSAGLFNCLEAPGESHGHERSWGNGIERGYSMYPLSTTGPTR
jgi:hypothetical protein